MVMVETNANDAERLLKAARAQGDEALPTLLELYRPYLKLLARLHRDQLEHANLDESDLVQETFLYAFSDFCHFRGATEKEFVSWLRTILATTRARLARKVLGTKKRDVRLEQRLQQEIDQSSQDLAMFVVDQGSSPSQKAARREYSVVLANAITRLKGDYREVIILHGLERLSIPDVAQRMGRTEGSTWKLWARALVNLRQTLRDWQ